MKTLIIIGFIGIGFVSMVYADVVLPNIFGENMVLQRERSIPVWGWASPQEKVTVTFRGEKASVITSDNGKWNLKIPTGKAGGPFEFIVKGKNEIKLPNVMVGEVWLCSGQSNMTYMLQNDPLGVVSMKDADKSCIRFFDVRKCAAPLPASNVEGKWVKASINDYASKIALRNFSAVGYFFGLELYKSLKIPIGLIHSSMGGSKSEAWTPVEGFEAVPALKDIFVKVVDAREKNRECLKKSMGHIQRWVKNTTKALKEDGPVTIDPLPPELTNTPGNQTRDYCVLYNRMIAPLVPFAIRGVIWYQGESNWDLRYKYYYNMQALIKGWREVWSQGDIPFYYVQLAPFKYWGNHPEYLPQIWEAQRLSLNIPNTGMAVINDIGNPNNIHPPNKHDVGKRLALWALAKNYDKDVVYSGPLYESMEIEGDKVRVTFKHAEGLKSRDGKTLNWFEIAGKDGKYQKAEARIDKATVIICSELVKNPVFVRYAWSGIAMPNLVNGADLPASSFSSHKKMD